MAKMKWEENFNMLKTSWLFWSGWNPDKVENWLEEMELKGWNLCQVGMLGMRFKFKKGESAKVRYCVDYQSSIVDDQYYNLFKDDGWELTWEEAGWYIWKRRYNEDRPSIYTDTNSLIQRNNRLAIVLLPIFAFIPLFIILLLDIGRDDSFTKYLLWIYIALFVIYGVIFYKIWNSNKKLKKDSIRE